MIRSSIDIGSNSVLLLIGEIDQDKKFQELSSLSEVTGLGREIDKNKKFIEVAMEETLAALHRYKNEVEKFQLRPEDTIVTATEAARNALNADTFFEKVEKETGFKIQIISAKGEAYFASQGIRIGLKNSSYQKLMALDVGGASTELIIFEANPFEFEKFVSLPVGVVRGLAWSSENQFEQKVMDLFSKNKEILFNFKNSSLIGIAGTMTSLAGMFLKLKVYTDKNVHGQVLLKSDLDDLIEKYGHFSPDNLLEIFPFLGKRSKTVLIGARLVKMLCEYLDINTIIVSTFGLRHGTLYAGEIKDEFK